MTATVMEPTVLSSGTPIADRDANLAAGADRLAGAGRSILRHPRFLLTLAGALMTFGLTAILLGWVGASRSTLIEEQVPYLISGGLLGLAFAVVGALMFFTHWLTVSIREVREYEAARRQDHAELIIALRALVPEPAPATPARSNARARQEKPDARPRSERAERPIRRASSSS